MRHFTLITEGVDVAPINAQLAEHPELWDQHSHRRTAEGTPHTGMSDIWVRYNDPAKIALGRDVFNGEHVPIWYPAWDCLQTLRPVIFDLMAKVEGEMLCAVLITKIPPGCGIAPHIDDSWHVRYAEKFYVSLQSEPGAVFACDDGAWQESIQPEPGQIYLFDNRKMHWVDNRSSADRVTLIICIRTAMFGRY